MLRDFAVVVMRKDPRFDMEYVYSTYLLEAAEREGARTVVVQRFIPDIMDGDKRVLLIAGVPVPFALARISKPDEMRGNLAAGGRGIARQITARNGEIAAALGPKLWADGLLIVGLDVIGDFLTEVNMTSSTCFVEVAQQTGFDVGAMFVDALAATSIAAPLWCRRRASTATATSACWRERLLMGNFRGGHERQQVANSVEKLECRVFAVDTRTRRPSRTAQDRRSSLG